MTPSNSRPNQLCARRASAWISTCASSDRASSWGRLRRQVVASGAPAQEAMLAVIADYLGLSGLSIVDPRSTPLALPSSLERKVARMQAPYREYLTQDLHFDDRVARRLLDRLGLPRPTLGAAEVHRIIELTLLTRASLSSL
jgi:hypothetical protein